MELTTATHGETAWVRIVGMLVEKESAIFRNTVRPLLDGTVKTIVLDFDECTYIDSKGLGDLVRMNTAALRSGKRMFVQNLNDNLQLLFKLTHIDVLFEIAPVQAFESTCRIILPNFNEINSELIEYFAKHPENLIDLPWRRFEELLDVIFKNQGFRTILGTGSADGGVDLRLLHSDACGELLTLVQAKRYRKLPIQLDAVQAFCAVMDDEKANRGVFVTTSRYLPVAQRFADRHRHRLVLADSQDVSRWCQEAVRRIGDGVFSKLR